MTTLNETHDPALRSWVASANTPTSDFPIQNLPFGVFRRRQGGENFRGGVAIGDQIVDLAALSSAGLLQGVAQTAALAASADKLNALMDLGPQAWSALRLGLSRALREGSSQQAAVQACLVPMADAEFDVPARIGDYTDFYTSVHHATNVGRLFRPDNPLLPNYKWVPIGYHGRASSIGVSGQQFRRPVGQIMPPGATEPIVGPCKRLDIELELGVFIGRGNSMGEPIAIDEAEAHVFGLCLFRPGNTSRWDRFCPRALPAPSRPGWSPWKRSPRIACRLSIRQKIRSPCRTWMAPPTAPAGAWTFN